MYNACWTPDMPHPAACLDTDARTLPMQQGNDLIRSRLRGA